MLASNQSASKVVNLAPRETRLGVVASITACFVGPLLGMHSTAAGRCVPQRLCNCLARPAGGATFSSSSLRFDAQIAGGHGRRHQLVQAESESRDDTDLPDDDGTLTKVHSMSPQRGLLL